LELLALFTNRSIREVASTVVKVVLAETLCAVLGFHGVDEGSLFVVTEIFQCGDIESGHHVVVFVDQVVAVEHVETIPWTIAGENLNLFVLVQPNDIFQCGLLVGKNTTSASSTAHNLEVDEMNVDWL
jgi:hypothetical protein